MHTLPQRRCSLESFLNNMLTVLLDLDKCSVTSALWESRKPSSPVWCVLPPTVRLTSSLTMSRLPLRSTSWSKPPNYWHNTSVPVIWRFSMFSVIPICGLCSMDGHKAHHSVPTDEEMFWKHVILHWSTAFLYLHFIKCSCLFPHQFVYSWNSYFKLNNVLFRPHSWYMY